MVDSSFLTSAGLVWVISKNGTLSIAFRFKIKFDEGICEARSGPMLEKNVFSSFTIS